MSFPNNPAAHEPADESDEDLPSRPVSTAKSAGRKEDDFSDFNDQTDMHPYRGSWYTCPGF